MVFCKYGISCTVRIQYSKLRDVASLSLSFSFLLRIAVYVRFYSLSFSAKSTRLCLKSHSHYALYIEHILRIVCMSMCMCVCTYLHLFIMHLLKSASLAGAFSSYYENIAIIPLIYLDSAVLLLTSSSAAA